MLSAKRRNVPLSVSMWMDKDVSVKKPTTSSGLMPNDTRYNVYLSRKFYSDMLNLSAKRRRRVARFEYDRRSFLNNQRQKAETTLPGLLPYLEKFKDEMDEELPTERPGQIILPSIAPSKSSFSSKKQPNKSQISRDRIKQLSQPKGQRFDQPHVRPALSKPFTAEDLFDDFEDISSQSSYLSKEEEEELSTKDKRFQKLIHLFSDAHVLEPTTIQSLKNVIQTKTSLQYDGGTMGAKNSANMKKKLVNDSMPCKTDRIVVESSA